MKGRKTKRIQKTPKKLKSMWESAARRACVLAERAARFEVMVVPMFSPMTSAIPWYIGRAPLEHRIIVMAITAADDCTQNVRMPPRSRKMSVVENDEGSKDEKKSSTALFSPRCISMPVARNVPKPNSRKDRPKRKSPM